MNKYQVVIWNEREDFASCKIEAKSPKQAAEIVTRCDVKRIMHSGDIIVYRTVTVGNTTTVRSYIYEILR